MKAEYLQVCIIRAHIFPQKKTCTKLIKHQLTRENKIYHKIYSTLYKHSFLHIPQETNKSSKPLKLDEGEQPKIQHRQHSSVILRQKLNQPLQQKRNYNLQQCFVRALQLPRQPQPVPTTCNVKTKPVFEEKQSHRT